MASHEISLVHPSGPADPRAVSMMSAMGHYFASDRPLFLAGYGELCRVDLSGGRAMEICGGLGELAGALAGVFPAAEVVGLDLYEARTPKTEELRKRLPGLSYVAGNTFDLSSHPAESFDLVFGQAALHHLAHDLPGLCRSVLRVLKPGGRLVFIFEPLGHNLLVAAVRAARMARRELPDESNLFCSQFASIVRAGFSRGEVQVFNLCGYPMKALSDRFEGLSRAVHKLDGWLFRRFPRLMRYAANGNLIFTK